MELTIPHSHSGPTALKTAAFQRFILIGEKSMKTFGVPGNRINTSGSTLPEAAEKQAVVPQKENAAPNGTTTRGMQPQQGRARAAGLRQALEKNAPATERTTSKSPAAGTVYRYPTEQKSGRGQRNESHEDLVPLDIEINYLNGSRQDAQIDRKRALAQQRQEIQGFKRRKLEYAEPADDLTMEGSGEDH